MENRFEVVFVDDQGERHHESWHETRELAEDAIKALREGLFGTLWFCGWEVVEYAAVSSGGWCAPGESAYPLLPLTLGEEIGGFAPIASRGGLSFTAPKPTAPAPLTDEQKVWRTQRAEEAAVEREARALAGGEWRYALAVRDDDGEVTIHDGSNPWDGGTVYLSREEALEEQDWRADDRWHQVVRRWQPDPTEWEVAP